MGTQHDNARVPRRRGFDALRMVSEMEWLARRLRVPGHAERIRDIALRIARASPGKAVSGLAEAVASRIAELDGQVPTQTAQASIDDAVSLLRLALESESGVRSE